VLYFLVENVTHYKCYGNHLLSYGFMHVPTTIRSVDTTAWCHGNLSRNFSGNNQACTGL